MSCPTAPSSVDDQVAITLSIAGEAPVAEGRRPVRVEYVIPADEVSRSRGAGLENAEMIEIVQAIEEVGFHVAQAPVTELKS